MYFFANWYLGTYWIRVHRINEFLSRIHVQLTKNTNTGSKSLVKYFEL